MNIKYRGIDKDGTPVNGEISGNDIEFARCELMAKGITVTSLKQAMPSLFSRRKVTPDDVAVFCEQLSNLVDSDMPLPEAINSLSKDARNPIFQESLKNISYGLEKGEALEKLVERERGVFPEILPALVLAGQKSGKLSETLRLAAQYSWRTYYLYEKVKATLLYPVFTLIVLFAVIVFTMSEIIPKFIASVRGICHMGYTCNNDQEEILSNLLKTSDNIYLISGILVGLIFLIICLINLSKKVPALERARKFIFFNMPIYGRLLKASYLARFRRSLYLFVDSGVNLPYALRLITRLDEKKLIPCNAKIIADSVEKGFKLSESLKLQSNVYPELLCFMVSSGEKTARLNEVLKEAAELYEMQTEKETEHLYSILPPAVIIIIGFIAALFMAMVFGPLYIIFVKQVGVI